MGLLYFVDTHAKNNTHILFPVIGVVTDILILLFQQMMYNINRYVTALQGGDSH
ncbi:hypothetical protein GCM10008983_05990 [Lentibacillus halophilus]|uniref:Uncharacterized protein n=1 Tax=Lentibacillus halophilus TaxID=295065 RepID=A0ABN0Z3Y9_9BACI